MTTQIKPKVGGAFTTVNQTSGKNSRGDDAIITALPASGVQHLAQRAINRWINAGGTGTHAAAALKEASAAGLLIQEI